MIGLVNSLLSIFKSDKNLLKEIGLRGVVVYYPLSKRSAVLSEIYIDNSPPETRDLCITLKSLLQRIKANPNSIDKYKYYTVIPIDNFRLVRNKGRLIYKKPQDTIRVHIPFTIAYIKYTCYLISLLMMNNKYLARNSYLSPTLVSARDSLLFKPLTYHVTVEVLLYCLVLVLP